jgi:hypothetical protein
MKKEKEKIYAPWQHRFIAGLFFQLKMCSDREVALYLQRESSYPKDGLAEAIFRSFAKGIRKFPRAWAKTLSTKCSEAFIERWEEKIFSKNSPITDPGVILTVEKITPELLIPPTENKDEIIQKPPVTLVIPAQEKQSPSTLKAELSTKTEAKSLAQLIENKSAVIQEIQPPVKPQPLEDKNLLPVEIISDLAVVIVEKKAPEPLVISSENKEEIFQDPSPHEILRVLDNFILSPLGVTSKISESTKDIVEKTTPEITITPIKKGSLVQKPLPNTILRILNDSLSSSLELDGKLNARKLVRNLNKSSFSYFVKRKGRELFFQGKRITHTFIIPPEIELTAS